MTQAQEVVAVVDCGASAVRAYIAEIRAQGRARVLEDVRHPVDLVDSLIGGRFDRGAMDRVVSALDRIGALARDYGVRRIRAVGTSVLREVVNRDVLIERVQSRCGLALEVIDSAEEARLYYAALRQVASQDNLDLSGSCVFVDIGASSTFLSLIREGKLVAAVDEHYGGVRQAEMFAHLRDSHQYAPTLDRYALGAARMTLRRLPIAGARSLLATGGEVRALAEHLHPNHAGQSMIIPLAEWSAWCASHRDATALRAQQGSAPFDPRQMIPAANLVLHLAQELGLHEIVIPHLNLRDGLLADFLPGAMGPNHLDRDFLLVEARALAERFGMDLAYAENTARLATQIFEQTAELHGLAARERSLLEFAAWVHDIGSFVNVRNRHKHSLYLILGCDIAGLSSREKEIVANVARYHRRSAPNLRHPDYAGLDRHDRVVVAYLSAMLRLAYGLDVDRQQRIKRVRCQVHEGRLLIHVDRRQVALERWSLKEKSDLFREVFGLDIAVIPRDAE